MNPAGLSSEFRLPPEAFAWAAGSGRFGAPPR
jgi:hypothetical protein